MSDHDKLMLKIHEITEFCMKNAGRCMEGWPREKIFIHLYGHAILNQLICCTVNDKVKSVAVVQPTNTGNILFGDIIGNRSLCRTMFKQVMERWPDTKKFFTYRKNDELVELPISTINRFIGGSI